jgi:3-hydroxyacyl-CoA dehydrogenase
MRDSFVNNSSANESVQLVRVSARAGGVASRDLLDDLQNAIASPATLAVVLIGQGADFCAGTGFDPVPDSDLEMLCRWIDSAPVPIIAALSGRVEGDGLALALAAHHRIASPDARLHSAHIRFGLLPGGGLTQRIPRLVGASLALDLLLYGKMLRAKAALDAGLIDALSEPDTLTAAALTFATSAPPRPAPSWQYGMADAAAFLGAISAARMQERTKHQSAEDAVIDAIEAALLLPFDAGIEHALMLEKDCATSAGSIGLRAAATSERRALRMPEIGAGTAASLDAVTLVLGDANDTRVMTALTRAGIAVSLWHPEPEVISQAIENKSLFHDRLMATGRLSREARAADERRLIGTSAVEALSAATHIMGPIAQIAPLVDLLSGRADVFATMANVSTFGEDISEKNARLVGIAFGPKTRLAEILVGPNTAPTSVALAVQLVAKLHALPVRVAGQRPVLPQLMAVMHGVINWLRGAGLSNAEIAGDFYAHGFEPGFAGLPQATAHAHSALPVKRMNTALVNAGLRLLADGTLSRPSDLDVILLRGAGYPRWLGGAMVAADAAGLLVLNRDLALFAPDNPTLWTPAPLLAKLIQTSTRLADLNDT